MATCANSTIATVSSVPATSRLDAHAFYSALQSAVCDAGNLMHLLDLAIGESMGMTGPAEEMRQRDRLSALLNVCRDLAEKISEETWPVQPLVN